MEIGKSVLFATVRPGAARRWVGILCTFITLNACTGEQTPGCLRASGDMVRHVLELPDFDRITVNERVRLVVRYGPVQEVVLETGEYLQADVEARVEEGRLQLFNHTSCNLFREYGITTFYITVPSLTEIRSNTGYPIQSDGVLPFTDLTLFSESFSIPEADTTDGSFDLDLQVQSLEISANGIAYFEVRGTAERVQLNIAAGDARIDARDLQADHVSFNHRGSNDMLVQPGMSLRGVIRGPGDVVSYHRPDSVDVEFLYKGRLRYED